MVSAATADTFREDNLALSEQDIKVAVIDRLITKGWLTDAVIVNEFVVANWARRADLAVINGKLVGIEIKSDLDNLDRLDGQAQVFRRHFDKFILVVSSAQLRRLPETMLVHQEVWEARESRVGIKIRVVRRHGIELVKSPQTLIGYLLKEDLAALARHLGAPQSAHLSRTELEQIALRAPLSVIRGWVLARLKRRYGRTSENFLKLRNAAETTKADLKLLSRSQRDAVYYQDHETSSAIIEPALAIPLTTSHLHLSTEELADLPAYVIGRKRASSRSFPRQ